MTDKSEQGNFLKVHNRVLERTHYNDGERFTLAEKMVYSLLLSFKNANLKIHPSYQYLSCRVGVDISTIKRATKQLEKKGIISSVQRKDSSKVYQIIVDLTAPAPIVEPPAPEEALPHIVEKVPEAPLKESPPVVGYSSGMSDLTFGDAF